jgi:hypothetical protein
VLQIGDRHRQGVTEDGQRLFERDAVLRSVGLRLACSIFSYVPCLTHTSEVNAGSHTADAKRHECSAGERPASAAAEGGRLHAIVGRP